MQFLNVLIAVVAVGFASVRGFAQDRRVEYWVEVDNKVVRPGESVTITWWCKVTPGPGQPTTHLGHPATVKYVYSLKQNLIMTTPVRGQVLSIGMNTSAFEDDGFAFAVGNSMYSIGATNINPYKPATDNPVWVYQYVWKPNSYENAVATVTAPSKAAVVALEVPALGKIFPQCAFVLWTEYTVYPAEFKISDTACLPDCNDDEVLNIDDFICFTTNFAMQTYGPGTDCDKNGWLSVDDFICFQTNFVLGC